MMAFKEEEERRGERRREEEWVLKGETKLSIILVYLRPCVSCDLEGCGTGKLSKHVAPPVKQRSKDRNLPSTRESRKVSSRRIVTSVRPSEVPNLACHRCLSPQAPPMLAIHNVCLSLRKLQLGAANLRSESLAPARLAHPALLRAAAAAAAVAKRVLLVFPCKFPPPFPLISSRQPPPPPFHPSFLPLPPQSPCSLLPSFPPLFPFQCRGEGEGGNGVAST